MEDRRSKIDNYFKKEIEEGEAKKYDTSAKNNLIYNQGLKVLTLNLWFNNSRQGIKSKKKGVGSWKERIEIIKKWLMLLEPDIVCFQEVIEKNNYSMLEKLLGPKSQSVYKYRIFGKTSRFYMDLSYDYGNAIISKYPITDVSNFMLPIQLEEAIIERALLSCCIKIKDKKVLVGTTHLNYKHKNAAIRLNQVRAISNYLKQKAQKVKPKIVVLTGDFNGNPREAHVLFLKGLLPTLPDGKEDTFFVDSWEIANGNKPGYTWSKRNHNISRTTKNVRVDYIFVSEPHSNGVGLVEDSIIVGDHPYAGDFPSDHFGVLTEIRISPSKNPPRYIWKFT